MQTDIQTKLRTLVRELCAYLASEFAEGDPLQLMWEGHMQYVAARWLLTRGWTLTFGEAGGNNTRAVKVSASHGDYIVKDCHEFRRGSVDLRISGDGLSFTFELKSFPAIGSKSGRAGMEKGLRKDWAAVQHGLVSAFIFVADTSSYESIRGERKGTRGPKVTWYIDLPPLDKLPELKDLPDKSAVLFRFNDRVVGGFCEPSDLSPWKDSEPPW